MRGPRLALSLVLIASSIAAGLVAPGPATAAVPSTLTAAQVEALLLTPQEAAAAAGFAGGLSTYEAGANLCTTATEVQCVRTWISDDYSQAFPYFISVTAMPSEAAALEKLSYTRASTLSSSPSASLLESTASTWAIKIPSPDGATDAVHAGRLNKTVLVRASCTGYVGQAPVEALKACAEAVARTQAARYDALVAADDDTVALPVNVIQPYLRKTRLAAGDVAVAVPGKWRRGSSPITSFRYTWLSCPAGATGTTECRQVYKGGRGYRVKARDVGRNLVVQVVARSEGGPSEPASSAKSMAIAPAKPVVVPASWAPHRQGSTWKFPATMQEIEAWIANNAARVTVELVPSGVGANRIPARFGNDIDSNEIFAISPVPGQQITGSPGKPGKLRVYYYQESLRGCPSKATFKKWFALASDIPMWQVTSLLNSNKCPWRASWSTATTQLPVATVADFSIEPGRGGDDQPVSVLTVVKPSVTAGLRLQFSIPDASYRQTFPEFATLTTDLGLVALANTQSAFEVAVIQANTGFGISHAQFDVYDPDGYKITSTNSGTWSSVTLTSPFVVPGTARVVASVTDKNGAHYEAFADIAVGGPNGVPGGPDVTLLDGRCMSAAGGPMSCYGPTYLPVTRLAQSLKQRSGLNVPGGLNGMDVIRFVTDAGHPLKVLVVNSTLSAPASRDGGRARDCAWYDLVCHVSNLLAANGSSIPKVTPAEGTTSARKPQPVVVERRVQVMPGGTPIAGVAAGQCLAFDGGAFVCSSLAIDPRRVGLTPGSLIGMDGASLVGPDGASLVGPDGGTLVARTILGLVGPDGASLIGMDGASLVGPDGASLIGPDGGTLVGVGPSVSGGTPVVGVLGFD